MLKTAMKTPTFDEYKTIKDELNPRFEAIDSKFESITWSVWSLPIFMTVIMALFTLLLKHVVKI